MADTINVTICLDKDIKEGAENLFNDLGMNLSEAVGIFLRQALQQGKIPFEFGEKDQTELSSVDIDEYVELIEGRR